MINLNIIQVYASTNDSADQEKDESCARLQDLTNNSLQKISKSSWVGDIDAKVGKDNQNYEQIMGKHGEEEANENGERFAAFCAFNPYYYYRRNCMHSQMDP